MSKSKGNVLDPLDLIDGIDLETLVTKRTSGMMQTHLTPKIEKATRTHFPNGIDSYGADALRFTFAALATTGRDIRFDLGRIEGYKNFCNKLWNASRYVLMNTEELDAGPIQTTVVDRWIRERLDRTIANVHEHFAAYRLDLAAQEMYEFTWHEFCDWYLELTKPVLQSDDYSEEFKRGTRKQLISILEELLRLMHPLMPFITEEIWQQAAPVAGVEGETIMTQPFPRGEQDVHDLTAVEDVEWIKNLVLGVRQIRGEMNISPGKTLPVLLQNASANDGRCANEHISLIRRVGRVESIHVLGENEQAPDSATALLGDTQILVPMKGLIDVDAERERLNKQITKVEAEHHKTEVKLGNAKFTGHAPKAVVTQERERKAEFEKQRTQLDEQLRKLDKLD